jgi:S1-C subfamily serine protease
MIVMLRALVAALAILLSAALAHAQVPSALHISIVLVDADGKTTPVPHHTLLVSDNPATAPPRAIVTSRDGTADVKLRPGTYTVESDKPVAFRGKVYSWTQMVDVVAGNDLTLELNMKNAEVAEPAATTSTEGPPLEADPAFLLPRWQDSVVSIWTPRSRASGFVIDNRGLVATNRRTIGTATSVEVQLTRTVKVAASVLVADPGLDDALLWIDPKAHG